ncbi:hypothetical protein Ndes2526B_g03946 [Nannochloris sp. 'desiccata']|nr:hypothetical protein NADE_009153 [Chlorella desiccata (nom. nud.)]
MGTNGLHWARNEQPLITLRVMWSTNNVFRTLLSLRNLNKQRWKAHVIFTGFKVEQHRIHSFSSFAHNTLDFANDNRFSFRLMESNEQIWTEPLFRARTPWVFILNDVFEIDETFIELLLKGMDLTGPDGIIFSSSYLGSEPKLITGNFFVGDKDGYAVRVKALATADRNFSSIQSFCLKRDCLMHSTLYKGKDSRSVETVSTKAVENVIAETFRAEEFPFIFSEKDDIYFGRNVLGLEKALRKAWERGCLRSGVQGPIHIIFRSNTPPMSSKYIQFQLEQHSSGFFTPDYIMKLKSAMQVWEFSPTNALKLQSKLNISNVFTVPTRTTYDSEDPPIVCDGIFPEGVQSMQSYKDGCYVNWSYASATFTPINIAPSPCGKSCNKKDAHDLWPEPEVLLYGYLPCSHNNCRENLCDKLHNAGFRTTCLHQVFGHLLNFFVCRAKIIVVEHYYANASLETHRIDALLLASKSVIAVPSSDPVLDALYSKYITFANKDTIISTVRSLLNSKAFQQSKEMQESFKDLATNTDPLCYALNHL